MAAPSREGTYRGTVVGIGLSETQNSRIAQVAIRVALNQWFYPTEQRWCSVAEEGTELFVYVFLEKKDGSANESGIRSLKDALGWDGSITALNDDTFLNVDIQVVAKLNEFQGEKRMKGEWIRHVDADPNPGVKRATADEASAIASRMGPKVRAVIGAPSPGAGSRPAGGPARPPAAVGAGAGSAPAPPPRRAVGEPPPYTGPTDDLPF